MSSREKFQRHTIAQLIDTGVSLGRQRWGSLYVGPARDSQEVTLTILPPSVEGAARRWLRYRSFVRRAALVLVLVGIACTIATKDARFLAIGTLGIAVALTDELVCHTWPKPRSITIAATRQGREGDYERFREVAALLDEADTGQRDPVTYEQLWGRAYRLLAADG